MSTTGGVGKERGNTVLIVLLLVAIGFAALDFWQLNVKNGEDRQAAALTTQIQVLSQQTAKFALESSDGNTDSFKELEGTRNAIDSAVRRLNKGDPATGMHPYADNNASPVGRAASALDSAWKQLDGDIGKILSNKTVVLDSAQRAATVSQQMPLLNSSMDQVVTILQQRNGSAEQMLGTSRQMLSADRIIRRVQEVLQGGDNAQAAADGLQRDAQLYGSVLQGLIEGNPGSGVRPIGDANARKILTGMQENWKQLDDPLSKLVGAAGNLSAVKQAGNKASLDSQSVLLRANDLAEQVAKLPLRRLFPNVWWGLLAALGAVGFALLLVVSLVRDQRRRFTDSTSLNQRNQEAIMRLLDEMGALAEGDLTVKTTVTEEITGAIADSVNYAIDELRTLVTTINETSEQVSSSAQETQTTARHLADAAEQQAQQISTATSAINEIASSMDHVSKNSAESADVAERSVQIASHGAEVVRETISGMDSIRDQIQETSKRIKRLGESSQEIGSIVELINDIAEQTNIRDPGRLGRRGGPRFRGGGGRSAAAGGTLDQRHQAYRDAGADDSVRYQRSGELDGTDHHRSGGRCTQGGGRRQRAGRHRARFARPVRADPEHLQRRAPAVGGGHGHFAIDERDPRDHLADLAGRQPHRRLDRHPGAAGQRPAAFGGALQAAGLTGRWRCY